MADITLRETWLGEYKGSVSSVDAGLSFADSAALHRTAASAWETSVETKRAREALDSINYSMDDMVAGLESLEKGLGLRMEAQTRLLESQNQMLEEIRGAVLTPAKTRAAERVADAAQLLRNERYERALLVSQEGIEADPNNPGVFFTAGWALMGLNRVDEAQEMFEEARDAASGDESSRAARQAARAAFVSGRDELAYQFARDARGMAKSADEKAAVNYDVAVYAWANSDADTAEVSLDAACRHDSRFCLLALSDRALDQAPPLRDVAARALGDLADEVAQRRQRVDQALERAREQTPELPTDLPAYEDIAPGLRPATDAAQRSNRLAGMLSAIAADIQAAESAEVLQDGIRTLDTAEKKVVEVERALPGLATEIQAQRDAGRETGTKTHEKEVFEAKAERYRRYEDQVNSVIRRRSRFLFWGVVLFGIGLLGIPLALFVGGALLGTVGVAYAVRIWSRPMREAAEKEVSELNRLQH